MDFIGGILKFLWSLTPWGRKTPGMKAEERVGRAEVQRDVSASTAERQADIAQAMTEAPTSRPEVVKKLLEGKF